MKLNSTSAFFPPPHNTPNPTKLVLKSYSSQTAGICLVNAQHQKPVDRFNGGILEVKFTTKTYSFNVKRDFEFELWFSVPGNNYGRVGTLPSFYWT